MKMIKIKCEYQDDTQNIVTNLVSDDFTFTYDSKEGCVNINSEDLKEIAYRVREYDLMGKVVIEFNKKMYNEWAEEMYREQ